MRRRILVWFSCGGPSAVAAKLAIEKYSSAYEVLIVNCDTRPSEHTDNYRFSREVEAWLGQPIIYLRNDKYADVDDVVKKERYMSGNKGAKCTTVLKKVPRFRFQLPDDIHVFGYTYEERGRRRRDFESNNPELTLWWLLIMEKYTKADCLRVLAAAGIEQPAMYRLGFDNNNCPGCLKASGMWYWDMVRTHFPAVFQKRVEQSRELGVRLVRVKGKRVFLDELPQGPFKKPRREKLSCGPECGQGGGK